MDGIKIISLDAIVYQKCIQLHGTAFGSKTTGPAFCNSLEDLIHLLQQHYDYIYHINHNYYIYDRYYGRRHRVIINQTASLYYAILVKDIQWI